MHRVKTYPFNPKIKVRINSNFFNKIGGVYQRRKWKMVSDKWKVVSFRRLPSALYSTLMLKKTEKVIVKSYNC